MKAYHLLIAHIIVWAIIVLVAQVAEAEEPTLEQCMVEVDIVYQDRVNIMNHILETCMIGKYFTARDATGKVHKFYCSKVIEL